MAQAKQGDRVRVSYTGKLEDGTVFDASSCEDDDCGCSSGPLEFTIGAGDVIPGFETAVIGMEIGETRTVTIAVDQAYGEHSADLVAEVPRAELPAELEPELGSQLEVVQKDGQTFQVLITNITDSHITIDGNHPLAGRPLTFEITLDEIA